jgi:transposase
MNQPDAPQQFAAYVAIDWADQKHVFTIQAPGQKKESGTLDQKPEAIGEWVAKLQERFGGQSVAVGVEQSRGALVHALLSYHFLVIFPIHPRTVARFREAFNFSGAKSDPLDTNQILEILTKHLDRLKPLVPDNEETRLLARLVEHRRKTVNLRTRHITALQAALKEYFPQALEVLSGNVSSRLACDFLRKWPTFQTFQQAKPSTIKRFFYGHNVRSEEVIEKVLRIAEKSKPLTEDLPVLESGARLSQMHAEVIRTLNPIIDDYDREIERLFEEHPEAEFFSELPGAGPVMAPRLLAAFGSDRSRYDTAANLQNFAGIAPVTRQSGRTRTVLRRHACPKFLLQTFHEFAGLSVARSQWARNYVDYYTEQNKKYHTIIRALAFKWIRILFRCWKNRTPYDETKHMEALKKRGSIFAVLKILDGGAQWTATGWSESCRVGFIHSPTGVPRLSTVHFSTLLNG